MDKMNQNKSVRRLQFGQFWLLRIAISIVLLNGLFVACGNPTATESTTEVANECTFDREGIDDYLVWFQSDSCNKGFAVASSSKVPVSQIEELEFGNPDGDEVNFKLLRPVINFDLLDQEQQIITTFDPPIRLFIGYTSEDINNAGGDYNSLAIAFLDDNKTWVKFDTNKNGYTLLESPDSGETFVYWDSGSNSWLPLEPEDNFYNIGGESVSVDQLKFAYQAVSGFHNDFTGLAFVHVSEWADRHIGAGS